MYSEISGTYKGRSQKNKTQNTWLHLIGLKYLWKSELTYLEINPDLRSKSDSDDLKIVLNLIFIFDDKDVKLTWMRRVESIRLFS